MTAPPSPGDTALGDIAPTTPPRQAGRIAGAHVGAARTRLFETSLRGRVIAPGLSDAADEAIRALTALCPGRVAVCATGGYGRGRLAPYSDIDLLLLTPPGQGADAEPLLYALFDSGLPVSQGVHDPRSALGTAKDDLTCRTAFLDARLVAGDEALFADFQGRFDKLRAKTASAFVRGKLEERDARHAAQDASPYAIEPDVKEGKGGLRDLDLLHWLDRYTHGIGAEPTLRIVTPGLFTMEEAARLRRAQDFLWSVRAHLHDLRGRADERLGFDVQPALADRLGYRARRGALPAERLMRHYFLNATEIGRLTGSACAALEARAIKPPRKMGFRAPAAPPGEGLAIEGDRLAFADPGGADVADLFALFAASGRTGVPLHPDTLKTATRVARKVRRRHRTDPRLAAVFVRVLRGSADLERILRRMNECGLLGRYLPAFGRVVGKAEYGLFRRYTLDEHVLRAIGVYARLRTGEDADAFPVTGPIARASDPGVVALCLLLQETEAGMPPRAAARADRTVRAQAMRLLPEAADDVVFAVRNRDLLARTAQRRAVTDPRAVADVAAAAGTPERLDLLALVTACRHRTAGVGSWRAYRNRDARLLTEEAHAYLAGGPEGLEAYATGREARLRAKTAERCALAPDALDAFFARADADIWSFASPGAVAELAEALAGADETVVLVAEQADGTARITVCAPDRLGLFGDVAGAVAEAGGTVWGASAFALRAPDRAVVIVEMLRPGTPPEPVRFEAGEADALAARVRAVVTGAGPGVALPAARLTDRRAVFDVAPRVRTYPDGAADSLVLEAEGLDRPGLLYLLTEEIEDAGLSVRRAYVATYGERAVDTFYLQTPEGAKVADPDVIGEVRGRLLAVLRAA